MRLGADPEYVLCDGNSYVPAIGRCGGTKASPIAMRVGMVQEDNVMAEVNVPPASTREEWLPNVADTLAALREHVYPLRVIPHSVVEFSKEVLIAGGKQAMQFGCMPELNPYNYLEAYPVPSSRTTSRVAGGHVHVDSPVAREQPIAVAQAMDIFLGVPSSLMDRHGAVRRRMYGKAGAMRIKPYGIEYRTLSNFWTTDDALVAWVWDSTARALAFVEEGIYISPDNKDTVRQAINHGSRRACRSIINRFNLEVPYVNPE